MDQPEELSLMAQLVTRRVEELKGVKSQQDIARSAGYKSSNMITLVKKGLAKVSVDKSHQLGKVLEADPKEFALVTLAQFYSESVIKQLLNDLEVNSKK